MRAPFSTILAVAVAAMLALGAYGAAGARDEKKPRLKRDAAQSLMRDDDGTPIIMQGLPRPKTRAPEETRPAERPERPIKTPRGSGSYVPPPVPSPYANPPPPLTQPPAVYRPPPIESFGDRVTKCIHSYPLNKGIGNNPTDQQMYIRQCAN
jgi:hypothetical protein